jgi:hypothetical protein
MPYGMEAALFEVCEGITMIFSALLVALAASAGSPLSRAELLDLAVQGLDAKVLESLVTRDCVDFDVSPGEALELSKHLSPTVISAAISCRASLTGLGAASPTRAGLSYKQVKRIAVIPFVMGGTTDFAMTKVFTETLQAKQPGRFVLIPSGDIEAKFQGQQAMNSEASLVKLLEAARAANVDAILLGVGAPYDIMGNPAFRIDVRMVELGEGKQLLQVTGSSTGGGFTQSHARGMAARSAVRKFP